MEVCRKDLLRSNRLHSFITRKPYIVWDFGVPRSKYLSLFWTKFEHFRSYKFPHQFSFGSQVLWFFLQKRLLSRLGHWLSLLSVMALMRWFHAPAASVLEGTLAPARPAIVLSPSSPIYRGSARSSPFGGGDQGSLPPPGGSTNPPLCPLQHEWHLECDSIRAEFQKICLSSSSSINRNKISSSETSQNHFFSFRYGKIGFWSSRLHSRSRSCILCFLLSPSPTVMLTNVYLLTNVLGIRVLHKEPIGYH